MSSLKLVLDVGANFLPGAGKALDAGLGMLLSFFSLSFLFYLLLHLLASLLSLLLFRHLL